MSATVHTLRAPAPEASAYAAPLSPPELAALSAVTSAANRLQRLSSGSYITKANREQVRLVLMEIGKDVLAAMRVVQR